MKEEENMEATTFFAHIFPDLDSLWTVSKSFSLDQRLPLLSNIAQRMAALSDIFHHQFYCIRGILQEELGP